MQRIYSALAASVPVFGFTVHTEPKEIAEFIPTDSANTETAGKLV